jgi:hypothetical protein
MSGYSSFKPVLTGTGFLFEGLPFGTILGWLLWLILAGWLVYSWYVAIQNDKHEDFAFALTLLMTLLLLPQTNIVNSLILMLPLLMVLRSYEKLDWLWLLLAFLLIPGSWLLNLVVFKVSYSWAIIALPFLLLPFLFRYFIKKYHLF